MPSQFRIRKAVQHLRQGGIIAYPTEGVFGLGCDPFNGAAVARLLRLKGRSAGKGLILIAADFEQIETVARIPNAEVANRLKISWPGPVTFVLPAAPGIPDWVSGGRGSIAVRVSAHPVVAALCRSFGAPLISTSANPGGRPAATTPVRLRRYFGRFELPIVPGRLGGAMRPTPIYDALSGERLRPG